MLASFTSTDRESEFTTKGNPPTIQNGRKPLYPTAFETEDVCAAPLPAEVALSQEAIVRGVPIAKRRVQQAGLRIADLLESAFAPGPLVVEERRR